VTVCRADAEEVWPNAHFACQSLCKDRSLC